MVSVRMRAGGKPPQALCAGTEVFILAESLGGVESLIEQPSAMTHASTAGSQWKCPTTWCGCRSASRTSPTCWPTSTRRWVRPELHAECGNARAIAAVLRVLAIAAQEWYGSALTSVTLTVLPLGTV